VAGPGLCRGHRALCIEWTSRCTGRPASAPPRGARRARAWPAGTQQRSAGAQRGCGMGADCGTAELVQTRGRAGTLLERPSLTPSNALQLEHSGERADLSASMGTNMS